MANEDHKADELAWEVRRTAERTDAKASVATDQYGAACGRQLRAYLRRAGLRGLVEIDEAIRRIVAWEQRNPPSTINPQQFDYDPEDAALANTT